MQMSFQTPSRCARGLARNRTAFILLMLGAIVTAVLTRSQVAATQPKDGAASSTTALASITVDYPLDDSVFPPEITPPTFIWRDAARSATHWQIDISFADGSARLRTESAGEPQPIGEIDQRCVSVTNQLPSFTPEQAAAHTWIPAAQKM